MKKLLIIGALTLGACGGTTTEKIVYMPATDAPTTRAPQTTKAPVITQPAVQYSAESEFIYDIESSYGPIYMDKQEVIDVGRTTCTTLRNGATASDIILAISSVDGDREFVVVVVASAVTNFCPDQAYKFN